MSFKSFNFSKEIVSQIEALGYTEPTPIQSKAIPVVLEGNDVLGLAQTGTGKTAAFALPILQRLSQGKRGQIRVLVIAPTRELADQINESFNVLGKQTGLRSTAIYGGVKYGKQSLALRKGVDILVACPGRLLDYLDQRMINLAGVETLVLDEADHMFDMGFLPTIKKIIQYVPKERQTLLFSATMPSDIERLATQILKNSIRIQISPQAPAETVSHVVFKVEQNLKTPLLLELLKSTPTKSVLIFTRTKHRAKNLGLKLQQSGFKAISLQGNLSQVQRQSALDGFRKGSYEIMVATDIAARGIDVSLISHVINYDIPDTTEAYTHRIGRTGRATRTGEAFTFATHEDSGFVSSLSRNMKATLEHRILEGFDYTARGESGEFARPARPARQSFSSSRSRYSSARR